MRRSGKVGSGSNAGGRAEGVRGLSGCAGSTVLRAAVSGTRGRAKRGQLIEQPVGGRWEPVGLGVAEQVVAVVEEAVLGRAGATGQLPTVGDSGDDVLAAVDHQ